MINSKIWAITGRTRVGKTKVINTLHYRLLSHNIVIGGILTRDVKDNGKRIGIELLNISTGITNELANTRRKTGPRIGKYRVNLKNLDNVVSKELESALSNAELIIIDMIGPMELYSRNFCDVVKSILISCALRSPAGLRTRPPQTSP